MRRSVLVFSIRIAGEPSEVAALRPRVEEALGCTFTEGFFQRVPALVSELLGMQVALFGWRGRGDRGVIRLEAQPGEERVLDYIGDTAPEIAFIDIGHAVADLLEARGAGSWYLPDAVNRAAEEAYAMDFERAFESTSDDVDHPDGEGGANLD